MAQKTVVWNLLGIIKITILTKAFLLDAFFVTKGYVRCKSTFSWYVEFVT